MNLNTKEIKVLFLLLWNQRYIDIENLAYSDKTKSTYKDIACFIFNFRNNLFYIDILEDKTIPQKYKEKETVIKNYKIKMLYMFLYNISFIQKVKMIKSTLDNRYLEKHTCIKSFFYTIQLYKFQNELFKEIL